MSESQKAGAPANSVGILGYGLYLPRHTMSAADIAAATGGRWSEAAVRDKLGILRKTVPGPGDGTQAMGARAAQDAIARSGIDPLEIDLVLCVGEEWKEYPLTTSATYIQAQIGAHRAWGIDIQQRCNTTVAAIKIAKDMMLSDPDIATTLIVGGYRNGELIDYTDPDVSFMYDLATGAGALLLRRGLGRNLCWARTSLPTARSRATPACTMAAPSTRSKHCRRRSSRSCARAETAACACSTPST